ncbi:uncharacterized protein LDX57_002231 [Aspergillus melleus]|uniref:uncharacterized protein n=1 Tax=Aspergillus melleus TaxID=138277 RepID=UPI001E8EA6A5|nr:uncharacterized protein LDX57_002231 [Aspergillus melleus]KAH8424480.1 hypothetical protein LDX57_002231 [Aspergillus melleus]
MRAGSQCVGYRDPEAIRFHDESQRITERARQREDDDAILMSPPTDHIKSISISLHERAASFIFTHYVRGGSGLPTGLASLANIHRSPRLVLAARAEYSVALAATNAALQDPRRRRTDAAVATVILLAMYGVVTCQSTSIINRWLDHVNGATKLLELRGSSQVDGPVGLDMFSQLRLQIVLSNLYRRRYTPGWLLSISHEAISHRTLVDRAQDVFFGLFVRVANLCAALRDGSIRGPGTILQTAREIDAELVEWTRTVHPSCRFTRYSVSGARELGLGLPPNVTQCHVYSDISAHHLWNTYRIARIVLHELIIKFCQQLQVHLGTLHPEHASACTQSIVISRSLVADICASVPWATGTSNHESSPRAAGMYRLMWPLFIAANSVVCGAETRTWIVQCLDQIGYCLGISQSLTLAQILRNGQRDRQGDEPDPEDIMLHEKSMRRGRRVGVGVKEAATVWDK